MLSYMGLLCVTCLGHWMVPVITAAPCLLSFHVFFSPVYSFYMVVSLFIAGLGSTSWPCMCQARTFPLCSIPPQSTFYG